MYGDFKTVIETKSRDNKNYKVLRPFEHNFMLSISQKQFLKILLYMKIGIVKEIIYFTKKTHWE